MTEADCKLVTLEHVLTNGITNDLGFQVRDKLILLVEAQSKFSVNIALRMLLYLAATYKEYVDEQKLDLYGSKPVSIPRPELYMVYTGTPRQLPEVMRLSDMYDGPGGAEIEIEVLRDMGEGNIVDQYIRFCEISDAQRKQYGYTMKAVEETLRICAQEGHSAGRQEGRQEGREEGIRAMVLTLKEFTADKAAVVQRLVKQFELLPQTAEEKVERYWNS